jgi:hypothetical protein
LDKQNDETVNKLNRNYKNKLIIKNKHIREIKAEKIRERQVHDIKYENILKNIDLEMIKLYENIEKNESKKTIIKSNRNRRKTCNNLPCARLFIRAGLYSQNRKHQCIYALPSL